MVQKEDLGSWDYDLHSKLPCFFWTVSLFNFFTGIVIYQTAFAVIGVLAAAVLAAEHCNDDDMEAFSQAVEGVMIMIQIVTMLWWGLYFIAKFAP